MSDAFFPGVSASQSEAARDFDAGVLLATVAAAGSVAGFFDGVEVASLFAGAAGGSAADAAAVPAMWDAARGRDMLTLVHGPPNRASCGTAAIRVSMVVAGLLNGAGKAG